MAFRPGGDEVATAASDGTGRVWRATRGEEASVDIGAPAQLVLRGDRLTSLSSDFFSDRPKAPVLKHWRITDGKLVDSRRLERPNTLSVMALSGKETGTAQIGTNGIVIRDLPGRKVVRRLHYPPQRLPAAGAGRDSGRQPSRRPPHHPDRHRRGPAGRQAAHAEELPPVQRGLAHRGLQS